MTYEQQNTSDSLMEGLLGDFLDESSGLLQQLNDDLLKLDCLIKASDRPLEAALHIDLLNETFRAAHSLKGLSGMMRLENVNGLTHKVENIFDAARNGTLRLTSEVIDLIFQAVDRLELMLGLLSDPSGSEVEYKDVQESIEALLQDTNSLKGPGSQQDAEICIASADTGAGDSVGQATASSGRASASLIAVVDDQDIPEKYVAIFIDESEQTLEELSEQLLGGQESKNTESLLTVCHRLKGSAASIGLHRIAHVAHRMEDLLQDLRGQKTELSAVMADAMLAAVDAIRAYIAALKNGVTNDVLDVAFNHLLSVQVGSPEHSTRRSSDPVRSRIDATTLSVAVGAAPSGKTGFAGRITFDTNLELAELKASLLLEKLHRLGQVYLSRPNEEELETITGISDLVFGLVTDSRQEAIDEALRVQGVATVDLQYFGGESVQSNATHYPSAANNEVLLPSALHPTDSETAQTDDPSALPAGAPLRRGSSQHKTKPTETLRVDIDRLDQLMSLAGQLVINKARFTQIGVRLKELSSFKSSLNLVATARDAAVRISTTIHESHQLTRSVDANNLQALSSNLCSDLEQLQKEVCELTEMRGSINELNEAIHQLSRVSDGIQSTVMDTRMVPIGPLFTRFKRVVRDLSRDNHKDIQLLINGEGTELDKRMIDELGDPLIHLIRNSADHGIELPEDRCAAGKPARGTVTLNAFHRGNRIVIQIVDDGRGLDADRIRDKARSKGLISDAEADRMTAQDLYQLIWKPGFSTAERVTEVSGRGMGMDIVLSKIEQLNGDIEVFSDAGSGTKFEIKLPLTMAIVPSLLTVVDRDVFAIPVESILEIVQIPVSSLPTVQGRLTARVRDRITSVVELRDLFCWNSCSERKVANRLTATLVVVGNDGNELAIAVDDLLGEQDVVIKSMEENFENVVGIAGASILGDGRVSLILDVQALLTMARQQCLTVQAGRDSLIQPPLAVG